MTVAGPVMDGNTFAAILTIIFVSIFGCFGFCFKLYQTVNAHKLDNIELHYSLVERYAPIEETFKMMRKVQDTRLMEAFLGK